MLVLKPCVVSSAEACARVGAARALVVVEAQEKAMTGPVLNSSLS